MFELFKSIFGGKKSEEETKVSQLKKYSEEKGYKWVGFFEKSGKVSFKNELTGIVITLATGDVVTTQGSRKFKRYGLSDDEIKQVIDNPRVRIENKKFQIIDK